MPENIGGISATITLDISDFEAALNKAVQMATSSSQQIGQAFNAGASGVADMTAEFGPLMEQIRQTTGVMAGLGLQAANQREAIVSAMEGVGASVDKVRGSVDAMAISMKQVGPAAQGASGGVDDLMSALLRGVGVNLTLAGIVTGMIGLGKASLEAFADLDRATLSLTALTGSATTAERELSSLRTLAQDEALSLPELIQANQRLTALGVSAEQIPGILKAAADGAAAMNTSLIVATNALDRMAASGSVAGRNLTQLGLTTNDLGRVMGVAASQVGIAFKALDESERIEVLSQALDKFAGVAEARAESLAGAFQRFENTATTALQDIGRQLAPATKDVLDFADKSIKALQLLEIAFTGFRGASKETAQDTQNFAAQTELIAQKLSAIGVIIPRGTMSMHEWHDALMDAVTAYNAHNEAATPTQKALQGIADKQQAANVAVNEAKSVMDLAAQGLNGTTEKAQIYERAVAAYDEAQKKATISTKALTDSFESDMQAAQKLIDNLSRSQQAFDVLTNTQNRTEQQEVALGIAARNLETAQKQLQAATDGLTQAQENHLSKLKVYGPAFDGISKIVSEISGGMRLYQQATKDAETGDTAYVTVVKSLTDAEQRAWTQLQALYTLRAQYIEQGTNTKAIDQDVAKAEKNLEEAMKNADLAAQGQLSTMGKGPGTFKSFADGVNQATAAIGNSNAILAENNKKIEASIQAAAGAVPAYKGMTSAFDNTTESLMRQSAAFKELYANASGLSAVEAELARTELGLPERIDAATNSFKEMTQQITGSANALELWATAVSYARSAMATTTPQEGITNGNDLTHQLALAQQLEAVQKIYSDAYIDAFGNLVVPEFNAPGGNSKNKITHGPMASISSGITQGTQPSGGDAGISGGNLRIDPNTGIPTSSNQVSSLSSVTQALTDAQSAYNSALSAMQKTGVVIPSQLQSLSDALQKATADYLGFGHVTESATSGLDNLSTAIGNVSVAAASSTAVLGTALSNTENTITQVTQATGALLKQINDIGSVPSATSVTPSSASPLAYGASGTPKVGTNWQNGINVTINNPVVTSQSQADAVGQQIVNTLRNVVGLKIA